MLDEALRDQAWDLAKEIAKTSIVEPTKVGCVITNQSGKLLTKGCNTYVNETHSRHLSADIPGSRHLFIEHAERNAIFSAARDGIALCGAHLFVTMFPCVDCARAIVLTNIASLITVAPDYNHGTYGDQFQSSRQILADAKVQIDILL